MRFATTLGDGFNALIEIELDEDADLRDIVVRSEETGQDITALIYGSRVWEEAWGKAQVHLATNPSIRMARMQSAIRWNQPVWW